MTNERILKKSTLLLVLMISSALAWGSQKKTTPPPPPPCPQGQTRASNSPNSPCKAATASQLGPQARTASAAKPAAAPSQPVARQQPQPQGQVTPLGGTGKPAGVTAKPIPEVRPNPTVKPPAYGNTNSTKKIDNTKRLESTKRIDSTTKIDPTPKKDNRVNPNPGPTIKDLQLRDHTTAQVSLRSNGKISDIHTGGMTIHEGVHGERRIESQRNERTLVSTGPHSGYVQSRYFSRGGRDYVRRDYVAGGRHYTRVYRDYYYGRAHYYIYAPAYYYHPAFYGWAYHPWASPVHYDWGWGRAPWFYGGYFAPAPVYTTASLWLTDYLLAANLQAAYQTQAEANVGAGPRATAASEQVPKSGLAFVPVYVPGTTTLAQGFSVSAGGLEFHGDCLVLHGGATAMFSFSVPPGQLRTVAYGVPTGSFLNNTPAEVSVNGVAVAMINQGLGGFAERTPTQLLLWQKSFGPGDYVLTVRSGGNNVYVYGLWLGQESAGEQAAPPESESASSTPMSPAVKQMVDAEVQRELQADQAAAPSPQAQPANKQAPPPALDPAQSVFVVSDRLGVSTADGQECELTAGDLLTRIDDTPDNDGKVQVRVMSSKANDCSVGSKPRVAVNDLQEMNNTFREQLDSGLKALADKSGTGGLPKAPDTGTSGGEVQPPAPDTSVDNELNQQQKEANQLEAQVRQGA